jgi:hypothetical protein
MAHANRSACDVCKKTITIPTYHLNLPNGWKYIFSAGFHVGLSFFVGICSKYNIYILLEYINWILLPLYIWSYHPLLREYTSALHFLKWIYPLYFANGQFYFPLFNFLLIGLVWKNPTLLIFINPYAEIWRLHQNVHWNL